MPPASSVASPARPRTIGAGTVVVACGAVNSAALLLRSANEHHPRGLANSSDQVGRNYMVHNNSILVGINPFRRNTSVFQKTLYFNDFYLHGTPDHPYPLGHVQLIGKLQGAMVKGQQPRIPLWALNMATRRSTDWWLFTEDLPDPNNRVGLRDDGGIQIAWVPNNVRAHQVLVRETTKLVRKMGYPVVFSAGTGIEVNSHQAGTVRAGDDPSTSVLDRNLPNPRRRQPIRRGLSVLPVPAGDEPSVDDRGQRVPGRADDRSMQSRPPCSCGRMTSTQPSTHESSAMTTKLTGGQMVVDILIREGVEKVFAIPGHGNTALLDAFVDRADEIELVPAMHEQGAAHMADGYYRASGKIAAVCTSIGPGATNTLTGLATAFADSQPLLLLTGAVHTYMENRGVLQEIDRPHGNNFPRMAEPVVKRWWQPNRVESIPTALAQAFNTMYEGRRGPVLVDIPQDLQAEYGEYAPQTGGRRAATRSTGDPVAIARGCTAARQCHPSGDPGRRRRDRR